MDLITALVLAVNLLDTNVPEISAKVKSLVTDVRQGSYARVDVESGVIYATPEHWNYSTTWFASVLVHEACHIWLWQNNYKPTGTQAELTCNYIAGDTASKISAPQYEINYWYTLNGEHTF